MPSKETLNARKLERSQQVKEGKLEWLCICCNVNYPREEFASVKTGYILKCKKCAIKEREATRKYRLNHQELITENTRFYEQKRKQERDDVIKKHNEMVENGEEVIICTKCKQEKPIISFKSNTRKITKHCYECRQSQTIIEARRPPDTRERRPRQRIKDELYYYSQKYCSYRLYDISKLFYKSKEEFETALPRDLCYNMMKTECVYCGFYKETKIGLDRVNPTMPHSIDNVLSCCETCNVSKNNHTIKTHITHQLKVSKHLKYIISPTNLFECPF